MKKRIKSVVLSVAIAAMLVTGTGCSKVAEQAESVAVVRSYSSEESSRFDLRDGFYYDTEGNYYIGHESDPIEYVIHDSESIESVLRDLGEVTTIDEILASNPEYESVCRGYIKARTDGDLVKARHYLSRLSLMVLKAQFAEYLNIDDINTIKLIHLRESNGFLVEYEEKVSKVVPGGVKVEETVERKYTVIGYGFNETFNNIISLQEGTVESFDELDNIYTDMLYNIVLKLKPAQGDAELTETESSIRKLHLGGRIKY